MFKKHAFPGSETGIIEISGDIAKNIFDNMKDIKEESTFAEAVKVSANIRCHRGGIDSALWEKAKKLSKKIKGEAYKYKCFFRVNEKGEVTAPSVVK